VGLFRLCRLGEGIGALTPGTRHPVVIRFLFKEEQEEHGDRRRQNPLYDGQNSAFRSVRAKRPKGGTTGSAGHALRRPEWPEGRTPKAPMRRQRKWKPSEALTACSSWSTRSCAVRMPLTEAETAPGGFFRRKDDMINNDERERRLIEFLALEVLGLVVRRELPDGSTELYFSTASSPRRAVVSRVEDNG
jgi:hypothetical protein